VYAVLYHGGSWSSFFLQWPHHDKGSDIVTVTNVLDRSNRLGRKLFSLLGGGGGAGDGSVILLVAAFATAVWHVYCLEFELERWQDGLTGFSIFGVRGNGHANVVFANMQCGNRLRLLAPVQRIGQLRRGLQQFD